MHLVPLGAALLIDVHLMVVRADGNLCGETDVSLRRQQRRQPRSPLLLSTRVLFKSQAETPDVLLGHSCTSHPDSPTAVSGPWSLTSSRSSVLAEVLLPPFPWCSSQPWGPPTYHALKVSLCACLRARAIAWECKSEGTLQSWVLLYCQSHSSRLPGKQC